MFSGSNPREQMYIVTLACYCKLHTPVTLNANPTSAVGNMVLSLKHSFCNDLKMKGKLFEVSNTSDSSVFFLPKICQAPKERITLAVMFDYSGNSGGLLIRPVFPEALEVHTLLMHWVTLRPALIP